MRSLLLFTLFLPTADAASLYTIEAVSPAGIFSPSATGISNGGLISGQGMDAGGNYAAFSFGSAAGPGQLALSAIANDVNTNGDIAGATWTANGTRATVWSGGNAQQIDIADSYGTGINDSGDVAGSGMSGSRRSGFIHSAGQTTFLDLGIWSTANDINNAGSIAGTLQSIDNSFHAFAWSASGGTVMLGTLGGNGSTANAINAAGVVAGSSVTASGQTHAFIWNGTMTDLGTLGGDPSAAYDINADGTVVGYSYTASGSMRAFVWRGGMMFDLNALVDPGSEWTLEAAYGINDSGQIVGSGTYKGAATAFLLNPVSTPSMRMGAAQSLDASAVPEPGTWFTAGAALLATAVVMRKRNVTSGKQTD